MAGAVIMGMAGEMLVTPFGALIAGFLAGVIPPLGFKFLTVGRLGTAKDTGPRSGDHPSLEEAALPTCSSQTCRHRAVGAASLGQHAPSEPQLFCNALPSPPCAPG